MIRAPFVRRVLLVLFMVGAPAVGHAVQPDEIMADPANEARARALSREIRCMVCQNQSIDDSDAPLARDLRLLVRERVKAGDSDAEVLDFLVARYGQFVLLKPRFGSDTLLLWMLPPVVLIAGGIVVFFAMRRRAPGGEPLRELSPDEAQRIDKLLATLDDSPGLDRPGQGR